MCAGVNVKAKMCIRVILLDINIFPSKGKNKYNAIDANLFGVFYVYVGECSNLWVSRI